MTDAGYIIRISHYQIAHEIFEACGLDLRQKEILKSQFSQTTEYRLDKLRKKVSYNAQLFTQGAKFDFY